MEGSVKKGSKIGLVILIILILLVLAAGGVLGVCFMNSSKGDQALKANDFETARACYEKDFLFGAEKMDDVSLAEAKYYVEQKQFPEAIAIYKDLGEQEEVLRVQEIYGEKLMSQRHFQEAMALYGEMGESYREQWKEAAAQHARDLLNQEKYDEAEALVAEIDDPEAAAYTINKLNIRKLHEAVLAEDFETANRLMEGITDRDFLNDWDYNDFNYQYAVKCLQEKDIDGAMEFFGYCTYDDYRNYTIVLRYLRSGNLDSAIATIKTMHYPRLNQELGMSWQEVIYFLTDTKLDENDLDSLLLDNYLKLQITQYDTFKMESYMFDTGDYSSGSTPQYVGPVEKNEYWLPVEDLNALKAQCGTDPQGKVLILRSQVNQPKNGSTYYAVSLYNMGQLYADLSPASLSEVEYLLILQYDYDKAGTYRRTVFGETDIFDFLRFKGRVELIRVTDNKSLFTSSWVKGTGEPDIFGPEVWQGSNLPNLGNHVITAIDKIR